jgi:hypothetical protein
MAASAAEPEHIENRVSCQHESTEKPHPAGKRPNWGHLPRNSLVTGYYSQIHYNVRTD